VDSDASERENSGVFFILLVLHSGWTACVDKPKNIYEALEIHRGLHFERSLAWSAANPDLLKSFLRLSRISKSNFDTGRQRKVA
jgi:hypothetical protein